MKEKLILALAVVASTLLIWLPYVMRINLPGWGIDFSGGMETVFANFDGPNYLIIAKTWYDKASIARGFSNPLPLEYYPAHLPLYPALVSLMDLVLPGTWATLLVTLLGTVLAALMYFELLKDVGVKKPLVLALMFLVLPARWLVVRGVGSPESWFIFFILASIYFFRKEKYVWAGVLGALAQLTKSPGVLLLAGYGVYFLLEAIEKKKLEWKRYLKASPLLLMLVAVAGLFWFYGVRTGDYLAYFHSGDNFHLFWPPFSIFSPKGQFWTGDFWLEDVIWYWLVFGVGVVKLLKSKLRVMGSFALVFWLSTLFVAHRDVARYILPIAPLVLIGWKEELQKKEFWWIVVILIIPVYLYAWNFMNNNMAPVADWTPYL